MNDVQRRLTPHERMTASELHPSHVDTGGVEFGTAAEPEGTDAAQIYYQGALHTLNHDGDFDDVERMSKRAPQTEKDWRPIERPYHWQPVITPNGTEAATDLIGFNARSVVIHNYTPQFAYLPELRLWVDPFRINLVVRVPLSAAVSVGRVQWAQPPGFTQPAALTGATFVSHWTEAVLQPCAGAVMTGHP